MSKEKKQQAVQTTGHAWDGDLQEFNNPLPTWWLWAFYGTVIFAIVYWVLFPAWPVGKSYTKGVLNDITYTTPAGKQVTSHWNTRALYLEEMEKARAEHAAYMEQLQSASLAEIANNEELSAFAYSMAKVLFADDCAACHQAGANGVIGSYPNLLDDDWLWGGTYDQIHASIANGHNGFMPAFSKTLNSAQMDDVAEYVISLSGSDVNPQKAEIGSNIFNGETGGCYYCHDKGGVGRISQGAANLTDSIWTIADVPGQATLEGKKAVVKRVIANGVNRKMPAWKNRLNDTEVKILTFYVHELGGGN
ncbi:MAG: cytochrome-c oxidase, cbb3-type subunit III [Proteobacteria bacterium]|jgi:cytochrome c oxidase cbb3-type subunit 3|nr:cytochrome-c oxidase, cbb3-type subunit III [Pseudomonadota bacterium]MCG6935264.1 cytochrome-c oxidase, cbb3-type subunit III [Pseudomonadota bacterium]